MGGKCVGFICFLTILASFWATLLISCPLSFLRGTRHLQYPYRIISALGKARKMALNLALSYKPPQLCVRPPISSIFPSFPSKKRPLAIVGMGGTCVGFIGFLTILASFWADLVISCPLSFLRVPGISNTPRIISPLGKAHTMALNLAFS